MSRAKDGWFGALLVAVMTFAGIAPTLRWLEFSSGSENLNASTVLEMHRDGGLKLIPTLQGRPRLAKPPWTAWFNAILVSPEVTHKTTSPETSTREEGYDQFAWEMRWPALACSCMTILAVYAIGNTIAGAAAGFNAACVFASSLLFLRFGRSATTDVQLTLWVTLCNAALVRMLVGRGTHLNALFAGACLGLAMMSKGPVALIQSVLPALCCLPLLSTRDPSPAAAKPRASTWQWIILATAALAVALPWPIYVLTRFPDAVSRWRMEITREGATGLAPDPWFAYFSIFGDVTPWIAFFAAALFVAVRKWRSSRASTIGLVFLVVPIVIMSFAKDKNSRYLFPMLPWVSLLIADLIQSIRENRLQSPRRDALLVHVHFVTLLALAAGLPIAGATAKLGIARLDGTPWYSPSAALAFGVVGALIVIVSWIIGARSRPAIAPLTVVVMLGINSVMLAGYRHSKSGLSEMKPIADRIVAAAPDAEVYYYDPRPSFKQMPEDLGIYLNRIVTDVREPTTLPREPKPQVIVMLQRENEAAPAVDGFDALEPVPWQRRHWWAFVRKPALPVMVPVPPTRPTTFRPRAAD